ncbi:unnamed protein product, partial [Prorocentrum cordatum]
HGTVRRQWGMCLENGERNPWKAAAQTPRQVDSTLVNLKGDYEYQLRLAESVVGGPMTSHFPGGQALALQDAAAADVDVAVAPPEAGIVEVQAAPPRGDAAGSLGEVRRNLASMAGPHLGGTVGHRWAPHGILCCLSLAFQLKPSAKLSDLLAMVVQMFYGRDGSQLVNEIRHGRIPLPSSELMRQARIRLDVLAILYERELNKDFKFMRYLLVDGSKQLGRHFLCTREDRIRYPRSEFGNPGFMVRYDLNEGFESRVCPLSTTGEGHSTALKKTFNVTSMFLMECERESDFEERRCEVFGIATDQGAEAKIHDQAANIVPFWDGKYAALDPRSWLWPFVLFVTGHLHLLFNALEEACKQVSVATGFFSNLATMCKFSGDSGMREKFQKHCCIGRACAGKFNHFANHRIDWRWEFMSPAIIAVMAVWHDVCDNFNAAVMAASETGRLDRKILDEVARVVGDRWAFAAVAEMFRMFAAIVEKYASRLEGCECHSWIWKRKRKHSSKLNDLGGLTGFKHCVWKGRQAAWWVAVGLDQMLSDLANPVSKDLDAILSRVDLARKTEILKWVKEMSGMLIEIARQKMQFWRHFPWLVVGVFWGALRSDPADMSWRRPLRQSIDESDQAVAAGRPLGRISHRLLGPEGPCGRELRELNDHEDQRLNDYPMAYAAILSYALAPLVERNVESIHARVSSLGRTMTYVHAPTVCARLREPTHIALLQSSEAFHSFCCMNYRKLKLFDCVLQNRFTTSELDGMSSREKLHAIYMCDIDSKYQTMDPQRDSWQIWKDGLDSMKMRLPIAYGNPTPEIKHAVQFIKGLFCQHGYYSLPVELYNAMASPDVEIVEFVDQDVSHHILDMAHGEVGEFDVQSFLSDWCNVVFFKVVNVRPEARQHMYVPHVFHTRCKRLLNDLHAFGAASQSVDPMALDRCDFEALRLLEGCGVVQRTEDVFHESRYSINLDCIRQTTHVYLTRPLPLWRCELPRRPLMSLPKLCHMVRLRQDGWVPSAARAAVSPGGPGEYVEEFSRPVSYFVALRSCDAIFSKGVAEICQRRGSNYYKCLLRLDGDTLRAMMERLAVEDTDDVFKALLKNVPDVTDSEASDLDADGAGCNPPRRRPRALQDGSACAGILAPAVRQEREHNVPWWETEWRRCWVTLNGHRTKVWFDNFAGRNGRRRAWCNCPTHGCGKIRQVSHNRDWFATALMLWHLRGLGNTEITRHDHLQYWLADAEVCAAPGVVGAGHAGAQQTFICRKCKLQKPLSDKSATKDGECKRDTASYVSISTRCRTSTALRNWWKNLSEDKRVEWYRKQQAIPSNAKRSFDELQHAEETTRAVGTRERDLDHYMPWWMFLERLSPHKNRDEIVAMWDEALRNPGVTCIFRRNEWRCSIWEGVMMERVDERLQIARTGRMASVRDPETLAELQRRADVALSESLQSMATPHSLQSQGIVGEQAPVVSTSLSEQPAQPTMANIVGASTQQRIDARRSHLENEDPMAAGGVQAAAAGDGDGGAVAEGGAQKMAIGKIRFNAHVEAKLLDLNKILDDCELKAQEAEASVAASSSAGEARDALKQKIQELLDRATAQITKCKGDVESQRVQGAAATTVQQLQTASSEVTKLLQKCKKAVSLQGGVKTLNIETASMKRSMGAIGRRRLAAATGAMAVAPAEMPPRYTELVNVVSAVGINKGIGSAFEAKAGHAPTLAPTVVTVRQKEIDVVAEILKCLPTKQALKLLQSHLKENSWGTQAIADDAKGKRITNLLSKSFDSMWFTTLPCRLDSDFGAKVYKPQFMGMKPCFMNVNLPPFGVMEARLPIQGSEMVMGIPLDDVPPQGDDLRAKRDYLTRASGQDVAQLVSDKVFCAAHDNKQLLIIPSGFVCITVADSKDGCAIIRWGISSDARDALRAKARVDMMLAAFAGLRQARAGSDLGQAIWLSDCASQLLHLCLQCKTSAKDRDAVAEMWGGLEVGLRGQGGAPAAVPLPNARGRSAAIHPPVLADDLYRKVFLAAHAARELSWASQSERLIAAWGVQDWPVWSQAHPGEQREAYVAAVQQQVARKCRGEWQLRARDHDRPVPLLSLCEGPVRDLATALQGGCSWDVLQGMRSLSRWRAGLFILGHVGGRRSWVAVQSCVLCGARHRSLSFHVCSGCPGTAEGRAAFWAARAQPQPVSQEACARALLSARPGEAGYAEAVALAAGVDKQQRRPGRVPMPSRGGGGGYPLGEGLFQSSLIASQLRPAVFGGRYCWAFLWL